MVNECLLLATTLQLEGSPAMSKLGKRYANDRNAIDAEPTGAGAKAAADAGEAAAISVRLTGGTGVLFVHRNDKDMAAQGRQHKRFVRKKGKTCDSTHSYQWVQPFCDSWTASTTRDPEPPPPPRGTQRNVSMPNAAYGAPSCGSCTMCREAVARVAPPARIPASLPPAARA